MNRRILIDTHVLLWWLAGSNSLGKEAYKLIEEPRNSIYVSAASFWEIAIKQQKGLLQVPDNLDSIILEEGFLPLPIKLSHGAVAGKLPLFHKDPFDRMLVAQANLENMKLMSKDGQLSQYDVRMISAVD